MRDAWQSRLDTTYDALSYLIHYKTKTAAISAVHRLMSYAGNRSVYWYYRAMIRAIQDMPDTHSWYLMWVYYRSMYREYNSDPDSPGYKFYPGPGSSESQYDYIYNSKPLGF